MKKLIKNYTTDIPVERTLAEIQELLRTNGARGIALEYDVQVNGFSVGKGDHVILLLMSRFSSRSGFLLWLDQRFHEELHQHGSESLWGDIMRLTFQGTALCVGKGMCHRLRGVVHERGTRTTVDDQCGYSDRCQPLRGDRAIPHDGIIVGNHC